MTIAGITGNLLPTHYIADQLLPDAEFQTDSAEMIRLRRRLAAWWRTASSICGPASGLRAIFDLVAMPLFGMLGFSARQIRFEVGRCRGILETPDGVALVLLILPWAAYPVSLWRDISAAAREIDARWCFVLAPPFLSLVEARGFAVRRSLDFALPEVVESSSVDCLIAVGEAHAFAKAGARATRIDTLIERANQYRTAVRADLQTGVTEALEAMARAIDHHEQAAARSSRTPRTSTEPASIQEQSLTLVYRVLFLLFAESRGLVPSASRHYRRAYAVGSLCRAALDSGCRFSPWQSLAAATRLSRLGCTSPEMAIRPFNGRLFARASAPALEPRRAPARRSKTATDADDHLRRALVALGSRPGRRGRELIQYRDLGVEQLGAVYERVLDHPDCPGTGTGPARGTRTIHSRVRKQTGTFYTPQPLADFVVRRTLAPLVAGACPDRILGLRVVDPAMGSGAFLVAACRYLAGAYIQALIDDGRASVLDFDEAARAGVRRLIAERCLAGVDSNPVAVQLARLSLWLTTLAHGKPLSFLDHRLRVGDSLIGAGPEDLRRTGAAGRTARTTAALPLFDVEAVEHAVRQGARRLDALLSRHDDTVDDVREKETLWRAVTSESSALAPWRRAVSLWCARWFWPEGAGPPPAPAELRALIDGILRGDQTLTAAHTARRLHAVTEAARRHRFFHWPLEFPDVFYDADGRADGGGFHAVIGNPPWEMLRRDARDRAGGSAEGRSDVVRFIRDSGLFPSCDRGHVNLYQPFLDRALSIARPGGRIGLILPWGLAVDDGSESLRRRLFRDASLETVVGLDNADGMFPIHRGLRFMVAVARIGQPTGRIQARFGVTDAEQLDALPGRDESGTPGTFPTTLTPADLEYIGAGTLRIPDLRRKGDLSRLMRLLRLFPRFGSAEGWEGAFGRELNATEARAHFGARGLPVIEGKHIQSFTTDTRSGVRIERGVALSLLPGARFDRPRLGYRDISGVANARSFIAAIVPAGVVTTHTIFCLRTEATIEQQHFLCGLFNSCVLNSIVRMLMGGHLTTGLVESLPVPAWHGDDRQRVIALLAEELSRRPDDLDAHALLEAQVARVYEFDVAGLEQTLSGFPLMAAAERERTMAVFRRISVDPRP